MKNISFFILMFVVVGALNAQTTDFTKWAIFNQEGYYRILESVEVIGGPQLPYHLVYAADADADSTSLEVKNLYFICDTTHACSDDATANPAKIYEFLKHIPPEGEVYYEIRTKEDLIDKNGEYTGYHFRLGVNIDTLIGNQIRDFLRDSSKFENLTDIKYWEVKTPGIIAPKVY